MDITNLYEELACQHLYEKGDQDQKDIVIIVHDQLHFIKECIDSLYETTDNFTLYLWDNASAKPTKEYLEKVRDENANVVLVRHHENIGFIKPNNNLIKIGNSPYIILLNSDTKVRKGWDTALLGWLKFHENCKIVGYEGGALKNDGHGGGFSRYGSNIDYVCGWCLCIARTEMITRGGIFDQDNLSFAYGEDSELSLRTKEAGFDIYALNLRALVQHYGNATAKEVHFETDTTESFKRNHEYISKRHAKYLAQDRIAARELREKHDMINVS